MSCLPSATYAGPGSTDNLWLPADGSATIRGNLEVTGNVAVDGGLYGPGGNTAVRCPAGAVGVGGAASLPTPSGITISDAGTKPSLITAVISPPRPGDGATKFAVNINNALVVGESVFLANGFGGDSVVIGSTIGNSILVIPPQNGMGNLGAPAILAPGGALTMNGNKVFVQITGTGSVTINPDPRLNGQGVPSAWNFTSNTGTIQSYFQSNSAGVVTLTSTSGAQTFGVLVL